MRDTIFVMQRRQSTSSRGVSRSHCHSNCLFFPRSLHCLVFLLVKYLLHVGNNSKISVCSGLIPGLHCKTEGFENVNRKPVLAWHFSRLIYTDPNDQASYLLLPSPPMPAFRFPITNPHQTGATSKTHARLTDQNGEYSRWLAVWELVISKGETAENKFVRPRTCASCCQNAANTPCF